MIVQAKITSKRQVTIPIKIMRKLGLNPGDAIAFEDKKNHIEIIPMGTKFSALDLSKRFGNTTNVKLSSKELNKARKQSWGSRHTESLKKNSKHQ